MDVLTLDIGSLWSQHIWPVLLVVGSVWSQWVWPILLFLIGLGLVVFVHEFGHFLASKWAGVKVEEFALGFGKRILGFKRGETEYRLNVLPLGGYVRMLGQDDLKPMATEEADPRSWHRAAARKRLVILSAGVVMNVIFAALLFVVVYLVGIRFVAPVVGWPKHDFPADRAGLRPGDRILAIDGKPIRRANQIAMAAILSDTDEEFRLTVARKLEDKESRFDVTLKPEKDEVGRLGEHYIFGITWAADTIILEPGKQGYVGKEKFEEDDRIVQVGGQSIEHSWEALPVLRANAGGEIEYVVERKKQRVPVRVALSSVWRITRGDIEEQLEILGMSPRIRIGGDKEIKKKDPAGKAGLKVGDVILNYAGTGAPSRSELLKTNEEFAGKETSIRVLRGGKALDLKITPKPKSGRVLIGIAPEPEFDKLFVARVQPGSAAAEAGIVEDAVLTKVNSTSVATWPELYAALWSAGGEAITLTYTLKGKERTASFGVLSKEVFDPDRYLVDTPAIKAVGVLRTDAIRGDPLQALAWSTEDTWVWMVSVYKTLRSITKGRASTKGISGPVGIGVIAVIKGREGVIELAYFIAMLSALVAVFNFLPLPMLDGGHAVLVLVDKVHRLVRGRPLPAKVYAGVQIVGLVLILGIFLAITFQDVARWVFDR